MMLKWIIHESNETQIMPMQEKVVGLQVLRGLAALAVLCFHLVAVIPDHGPLGFLKPIFSWGFAGVDVFFVISGYVMWHSTFQAFGADSARTFLLHRFLRIYLGYWPFLILAFLAGAVYAPGNLASKNWIGSVFLVEPKLQNQVLGVAWSLVMEQYFYVLFAGLLFLIPSSRRRAIAGAAVALFAANFVVFTFAESRLPPGYLEPWSFFYSPFVLEFFVGSALAALRPVWFHGGRLAIAGMVIAIGVVVTGIWTGVDNELSRYVLWVRCTSFGAMAIGLVALMVILQRLSVHWPSVLVRIGDSSYTLYLFHTLAIAQAIRWNLFNHPTRSATENSVAVALGAMLIVVMSYALYRTLELPLYRFGLRRCGYRRTLAVLPG